MLFVPLVTGYIMDYISLNYVFFLSQIFIVMGSLMGDLAIGTNEDSYRLVGKIFFQIGNENIYRCLYLLVFLKYKWNFAPKYGQLASLEFLSAAISQIFYFYTRVDCDYD